MRLALRKQLGLADRLSVFARAWMGRDPHRHAYYEGRVRSLGSDCDHIRQVRAEAKRQRKRERNLRIAEAGGIGVVS